MCGHANADRDRSVQMSGVQQTRRFNPAADIFGGVHASLDLSARQQYPKFISAATPEHEIRHPDGLAQNSRQRDKRLISGQMSMKVVDVFEIVHIDQHQGERGLVTLGSGDFADDHFIEESLVVQSRQRIRVGSFL